MREGLERDAARYADAAGRPSPGHRRGGAGLTGGTLEVEEVADCRFAVRGHLDLDTVPVLRNALRAVIEPGATIELDFSEVTFLDSSGLQALVTMASDVAPGRVNVVGVSGGPLNVLSLTGLLDIRGLHVVPLEG